jgi:hypothetical protein
MVYEKLLSASLKAIFLRLDAVQVRDAAQEQVPARHRLRGRERLVELVLRPYLERRAGLQHVNVRPGLRSREQAAG